MGAADTVGVDSVATVARGTATGSALLAMGARGLSQVEGTAHSIGDDVVATAVSGRLHAASLGFATVQQNRCDLLHEGEGDGQDGDRAGLGPGGKSEAGSYSGSMREGSGVDVRWVDCGQRLGSDPDALAAQWRLLCRDLIASAVVHPLVETCELIAHECSRTRRAIKDVRAEVPQVSLRFLLCDQSAPTTIEDGSSQHAGRTPGQLGTYFTKKALPALMKLFEDKRRFYAPDEDGRLLAVGGGMTVPAVGRAVLGQLSQPGSSGVASLWDMRKNLLGLCVPPTAKMFPGYCVRRLRELVQERRLSQYVGDGGGSHRGKGWSDDLPTDAELCLNTVFGVLDQFFASKAEEKELSVGIPRGKQGRLFTDAFVVTPQSLDTETLGDRQLPLIEVRHSRPLDIAIRFNGRVFLLADPAAGARTSAGPGGRRSEREMLFRAMGVFFGLVQSALRLGRVSRGHGRPLQLDGVRSGGLAAGGEAGLGLSGVRGRAGRRATSRPRRRASRGRSGAQRGFLGGKGVADTARHGATVRVSELPMQHGVRCAVDFDRDLEFLRLAFGCLIDVAEGVSSGSSRTGAALKQSRSSGGVRAPVGQLEGGFEDDWEVF